MKRVSMVFAAIGLVALLFVSPAQADLTYFTGTDANHDGIDDQFTVNGGSAWLVTETAYGWPTLPDATKTLGSYISWDPDQSNAQQGNVQGGLYTYAFNFNWAGSDLSTTFDFRYLSDDYLSDIKLNGTSLGVNNLSQSAPWTNSYSAPGVAGNVLNGTNTIEFLVWNTGGNQPPYYGTSGPTGMAADFTVHGDATTVPEPVSLLLLGLGLLSVGCIARKGE